MTAAARLLPLVAALLLPASGCASAHRAPAAAAAPVVTPSPYERFGVEVVSLRPTAAGTALDLRLRVIDPEKAAPLFDRHTPAALEAPTRSITLSVPTAPKVGALRQHVRSGLPRRGAVYFLLFGNPHRTLVSGDTVTVVIGDFRAPDLVIQ